MFQLKHYQCWVGWADFFIHFQDYLSFVLYCLPFPLCIAQLHVWLVVYPQSSYFLTGYYPPSSRQFLSKCSPWYWSLVHFILLLQIIPSSWQGLLKNLICLLTSILAELSNCDQHTYWVCLLLPFSDTNENVDCSGVEDVQTHISYLFPFFCHCLGMVTSTVLHLSERV